MFMALFGFWKRNDKRSGVATAHDSSAAAERRTRLDALQQSIREHLRGNQLQAAEQRLNDVELDLHDHPEIQLLRAEVCRRQGHLESALKLCHEALETIDRPALAHFQAAECHLARPDLPSAIDALNIAVTLEPDFGLAWFRLGETLRRLSRHAEALDALQQALPLIQETALLAKTWLHLGLNEFGLGRTSDAMTSYQRALELEPELMEAHIGLGHAYLWQDEDRLALAEYQWVCDRDTSPSKHLLLNMGSAHQNCGEYAQARALFEKVIFDYPGEHLGRWYLCQLDLLEERWKEGWDNYNARFGAGASPYRPLPYRLWDGHPVPDDTLLVLADQGLGDEIMFASCLQDARHRVGHLILECEPRLQSLFARSFPGVEVVAPARDKRLDWLQALSTPPQWQIPSGNLPALFRNSAEAFPDHRADPARVQAWHQRLTQDLGSGLKIGISWRGGTDRTRLKARSMPLPAWGPLLQTKGVHFVNLQYGNYEAELDTLRNLHQVKIQNYREVIADYDETSALVCALDVVVTVCTAIVHLAGALGKPVWVLTPHSPGWRYTARGTQLPWYPSSRLFRQLEWGSWDSACQELSVALAALTDSVTSTGDYA